MRTCTAKQATKATMPITNEAVPKGVPLPAPICQTTPKREISQMKLINTSTSDTKLIPDMNTSAYEPHARKSTEEMGIGNTMRMSMTV